MMDAWWDWGHWAYRASIAQANGAGGAIKADFTPAAGDAMIVTSAYGLNSGTNNLRMGRLDEDNNIHFLMLNVASAATTEGSIPQTNSGAGTDSANMDSTDPLTRFFRGDDIFSIEQSGAGAQNDTLLVVVRALLSSSVLPTVAKGRSSNPADVTITPTVNKIL